MSETNKDTKTRYEELIFQTTEPDQEEIEDIIKNFKYYNARGKDEFGTIQNYEKK